jgi:hypothetical protein
VWNAGFVNPIALIAVATGALTTAQQSSHGDNRTTEDYSQHLIDPIDDECKITDSSCEYRPAKFCESAKSIFSGNFRWFCQCQLLSAK